jgi:hypothetical protein
MICEDQPDFYKHREPVARREHRCCECSAPILVGERHFYASGMWHGKVDSFRQHLICMEACMLIRDEFAGGDCIGFGSLKEEFNEMREDNWHAERDRFKLAWRRLRGLMAKILWRERAAKRAGR